MWHVVSPVLFELAVSEQETRAATRKRQRRGAPARMSECQFTSPPPLPARHYRQLAESDSSWRTVSDASLETSLTNRIYIWKVRQLPRPRFTSSTLYESPVPNYPSTTTRPFPSRYSAIFAGSRRRHTPLRCPYAPFFDIALFFHPFGIPPSILSIAMVHPRIRDRDHVIVERSCDDELLFFFLFGRETTVNVSRLEVKRIFLRYRAV